jgi:hypothetical protein
MKIAQGRVSFMKCYLGRSAALCLTSEDVSLCNTHELIHYNKNSAL